MAADITQNAAEIASIVEPVRTSTAFTMRAGAQGLDHPANCPPLDQIARKNCAFNVQALAVVNRVLAPGPGHHGFGVFQLFESSQRCFVGEIIFTRRHHL